MPPAQNYGTTELRVMWRSYECKLGGEWADIDFFEKKVGGVPEVMVDAYAALDKQALTTTGYKPPEKAQSLWSYVCRNIASSGRPSLHSFGIAIDIDPYHNPQAHVPPFSGGSARSRSLPSWRSSTPREGVSGGGVATGRVHLT